MGELNWFLNNYTHKELDENTVRVRKDGKYYVFTKVGNELLFGEWKGDNIIARAPYSKINSFIKECMEPDNPEVKLKRLVEEAKKEYIEVMGHRPDYTSISLDNSQSRWGVCKHTSEGTFICISKRLMEYSDMDIKETIIHEFLHTEPHCQNHQSVWRGYARKFDKLGYNIKRCTNKGEPVVKNKKHLVRCPECGYEWYRVRESNLTLHPENYKCHKCRVPLERIY